MECRQRRNFFLEKGGAAINSVTLPPRHSILCVFIFRRVLVHYHYGFGKAQIGGLDTRLVSSDVYNDQRSEHLHCHCQ